MSKDLTPAQKHGEIRKVVDHILLVHCGPIHQFNLSINSQRADIDRWIVFLSRNGIKHLTLKIKAGQIRYQLPSCLFSVADLTHLELYRCTVIPPNLFEGFSGLTVLNLQCVCIADDSLSAFLSLCPLLRKLLLREVTGCTCLKISAKWLVDFVVCCGIVDIHLENTPLLATASFSIWDSLDEDITGCNIVKLLGHLPSLLRLELCDDTLQHLAVGDVPISLPVSCPVTDMLIHINFEDMQELLVAFCIFRSSLYIKRLVMMAASDNDTARTSFEGFWVGNDLSCTFSHLQTVEVACFTGMASELKFIEFVLANAPVLERVNIKFDKSASDMLKVVSELNRYPRISPRAEVFVPV